MTNVLNIIVRELHLGTIF